ncbi:hypothetical protein PIB30_055510 [Stylosanthes scabra]|uniref:Eukaryotic initiation factor 4A n=1 Tax=Stylosanthes scabra TaxID=79078 RepID=A0ABU6XGW5_9FABA|nr:hypothetical protein [Stylosanthes scabra]
MAMDSVEGGSPSPSPSPYSGCRHFYLAVDRLQFKMQTVVDLLGLVGRRPTLPLVVCCSSRDDLDSLCSAVSGLPFISSSTLYSDLSEHERASTLDKFRQLSGSWTHFQQPTDTEDEEKEATSHMIIVTDACLPLVSSGESPLNAHLLINYDLPGKKETYSRRLSSCLSGDGIVINMVVGGEVVTLKAIEDATNIVMQEMPMQILDIL